MANVYRIFTITDGTVTEGADVGVLSIKGAGIDIPAISVGESGRGRRLGTIVVQLPPSEEAKWLTEKKLRILAAEVGKTKAGAPKLLAKPTDSDDHVIVVLRTTIGFRGGNGHTGDRSPTQGDPGTPLKFEPFPGETLVSGTIAQGDAGGMGSGEQLIALIPKGTVFRACRSGRLYGSPGSHYYTWDGTRLLAATWDERVATDLF